VINSLLEFVHVGQRWQHHKGAHYRIILISNHSDNDRPIINYAPINPKPDDKDCYAHFIEDFLAKGEEYIGSSRFQLIDELDYVD
jgi:hypothetical protein